MRIIMDTFDALKYPLLHGVVKPDGFSRWEAWDKTGWVVRNGYAADLLEAIESLKAAGEWPSEEDLGMVGGRVVMPVPLIARKRAAVLSPTSSRHEGRRDRLSEYY